MNINFDNIFQHVIPMDDFRLKWRFTEEKYDKLPDLHLEQLKPLDDEAAKFLWDYITERDLHNDTPFKKDFCKLPQSRKIRNKEHLKLIFGHIEWGLLNQFDVDEDGKSDNKKYNELKNQLDDERKKASP